MRILNLSIFRGWLHKVGWPWSRTGCFSEQIGVFFIMWVVNSLMRSTSQVNQPCLLITLCLGVWNVCKTENKLFHMQNSTCLLSQLSFMTWWKHWVENISYNQKLQNMLNVSVKMAIPIQLPGQSASHNHPFEPPEQG